MQSKTFPASMHCTNQWHALRGTVIEVFLAGEPYRRALVDDAMPDASGLWLASDGAYSREYIDKASGYQVWTSLYPLSIH